MPPKIPRGFWLCGIFGIFLHFEQHLKGFGTKSLFAAYILLTSDYKEKRICVPYVL